MQLEQVTYYLQEQLGKSPFCMLYFLLRSYCQNYHLEKVCLEAAPIWWLVNTIFYLSKKEKEK